MAGAETGVGDNGFGKNERITQESRRSNSRPRLDRKNLLFNGPVEKVGVHFVRGSGRCENSPAIYRWGSIWQSIQSAKRTVESQVQVSITSEISETLSFSRPFDGLFVNLDLIPALKCWAILIQSASRTILIPFFIDKAIR